MGILRRIQSFFSGRENLRLRRQLEHAIDQVAKIRASYDAARTTDEFKNYWANADAFDADSAHSPQVRHTLIRRSRYEIGSNGYADGIAQTYATDVIGIGPTLRMQTNSPGFNQMVELSWFLWAKAIGLRRKLWCMAHAKHQDGEAFGVLRRNPGVKHPIPLDVVLYEAEQFQTPMLPFVEGRIDGVRFDQWGNPTFYDLMRYHPGSTSELRIDWQPEAVPADSVLHWFKLRRPGQHRAVPECSSTLNVGAASRRWREATVAAAETAADFAALVQTLQSPDEGPEVVQPFSSLDIVKRMMTFLPEGWGIEQMRAEHPNATYEAFHKAQVNEQARPKSMPYNKAACDSSSYNYASGRLDHQTYYGALDVDREDCSDLVLDRIFDEWFTLAITRFQWLGGDPAAVGAVARLHGWDYPKHKVADVESEANANETRLKSGQISLSRLYSDCGLDLEDEIPQMAATFGVDESEVRKRLLDIVLPAVSQGAQPAADEIQKAVANAISQVIGESVRRGQFSANGNGAHHGQAT